MGDWGVIFMEKNYIMVKSLILNCRLTKYRSQNNRLSVRTSISQRSQRCALINQRGRRILLSPNVFPCVSLVTLFVDADRRYLRFRPTLARTHILSLCLSATLPYLLPFIRRCAATNLINRNIHFSVFSSIISKVAPPRNWWQRWDEKSFLRL